MSKKYGLFMVVLMIVLFYLLKADGAEGSTTWEIKSPSNFKIACLVTGYQNDTQDFGEVVILAVLERTFRRCYTTPETKAILTLMETHEGIETFKIYLNDGYEDMSYDQKYDINTWQIDYPTSAAIKAFEKTSKHVTPMLKETFENFEKLYQLCLQ